MGLSSGWDRFSGGMTIMSQPGIPGVPPLPTADRNHDPIYSGPSRTISINSAALYNGVTHRYYADNMANAGTRNAHTSAMTLVFRFKVVLSVGLTFGFLSLTVRAAAAAGAHHRRHHHHRAIPHDVTVTPSQAI